MTRKVKDLPSEGARTVLRCNRAAATWRPSLVAASFLLLACGGSEQHDLDLSLSNDTPAPRPLVVGGTVATPEKIFATVAIVDPSDNNELLCTGSLLAPTVVLTAAHCVTDPPPNFEEERKPQQLVVVAGKVDTRKAVQADSFAVASVKVHPDWPGEGAANDPTGDKPGQYHDLAVLLLAESVEAQRLRPVPLLPLDVARNLSQGDALQVAGYGYNSAETETALSGVLHVADIEFEEASEVEFLAGNGGADACPGDSGGPVYRVHEGKLFHVGVTSRAAGEPQAVCGETGSIYALAPAYDPWLREVSNGAYPPATVVEPPAADDSGCTLSGAGLWQSSRTKGKAQWRWTLLVLGMAIGRRFPQRPAKS